MKNIVIVLFCLGLLVGCAAKPQPQPTVVLQCPPFPQPSHEAIVKIQSLHDPDVDAWIVELFKLKKQLKIAEQANK